MAELGSFAEAEYCGHYAFALLPIDTVVCGRAAKCCKRDCPENEEITIAAYKVYVDM